MDTNAVDLAFLIFRCGLGGIMLAHGINHIIGGGKIEGTAGWFGSMGMKNPMMQAWLASITEVAAGLAIILGLFTPFGGAGVVGVMTVAWLINHRSNGFFIFRPGEGWEYVMMLLVSGILIGTIGPGGWSLDRAFNIDDDLVGMPGLLISLSGIVGGLALLAVFWKPPAPKE